MTGRPNVGGNPAPAKPNGDSGDWVILPGGSKRGPQFETGKPLSNKSFDAAISQMTDPTAGEYKLVYDADLSKLGAGFAYTTDNSASVGGFARIGLLIELESRPANGGSVFEDYTQRVFVTMKAFTTDVSKISFPIHSEKFQTAVESMNVFSTVAGINGMGTGSIEFWANDYLPGDDNSYNKSDQTAGRDFGYGSMQVFNPRGDTVFAINGWGNGPKADIGIGNSSVTKEGKTHTDWTFANNADTYTTKRLRVYVSQKP